MAVRDVTVREALVAAVQRAADYNPLVEVPPCAIIWPDPAREWEALVPALQSDLSLLVCGPYHPADRTGPSTWILCALAEERVTEDGACPPVVYLPGIEARTLAEVSECSHPLLPLAALQYRAAIWLRPDGREWSAADFFQHRECGLGLQLKPGPQTEAALRAALPRLIDLPLAMLEEQSPLRASDFEAMGAAGGSDDADLRSLIAGGENDQVEFKATARWSTKGGVYDPKLEAAIVKEVGAFLNSRSGGTLLIGVEDDGTIRGLDEDYAVTKPKRLDQSRADAYFLWLGSLLLGAFGNEFISCLRITPHQIEGEDIAQVVVDPAPWPAFAGKEEQFFARVGSSSVPLTPRQAAEYVRKRWG
jgi:hypothetical protein